ncbi:visual system homeobox 1-like [Centroberyx affinis]|uniref:visual system homeobox 1-like n=1 Tax=Centroberyx affinis TaxID=166261 RepID=UPI003A5C1EF3
MHKKSLEMTKKCPGTPESGQSEPFCEERERGGRDGRDSAWSSKSREAAGGMEEEEVEEGEEEEEDMAIDLSSTSKQQDVPLRPGSAQRRTGSESDEQS